MKVMMLFFLGLMIVAFLALAVHDIRVSQANHDANDDVLCYWTLVRKRIEPGNDENCIPAIAKNRIIGDSIRVCNTVDEYDGIVTAAVSKWNTAFSPSSGKKIAPQDIFMYDSGDCTNHQSDSDKIASIVIKAGVREEDSDDPDQCDGTPACAVPAFIKDSPEFTYTGQGIVYVFPTEIRDTIIAAGKKKTIENEKALAVAHEMGHFLGFVHPSDHVSRRNICPEMGPQIPIISIMTAPETSGDLSRTWLCTSEISQYDENRYKQIYSPESATNLMARSSSAGRVTLTWNATNVHVEKDFEIRRCTGRKTACDAESASWTGNVKTVAANSTTTTLTGQGSGWRSYRVVSRTSALTGAQAEAESTTVEVNVAAPSGGGGDTSGGDTSGGDTSGGDTSGGDTSGGDTSGGDTSGGDTSGGDTSGGDTSGGDTSGGDTSGGDTSGGDTNGGDTNGGDDEGEDEEEEEGDPPPPPTPQCTLSATAGAGGSVSPTTWTGNCGTRVTLRASPNRPAYGFGSWTGCSSTTTSCTVTVGSSDGSATTVPVSASFTARYCRLRFVVGSGAGRFTTNPASGVVQCGQPISYWATAGTGHCFSRWGGASLGASGQAGCRTSSGVQRLASLTADFTFTAHFTKKRYTLRITATALQTQQGRSAGSVSPRAGTHTYAHGTRVTITATGLFRSVWNWGGACSGSGRTCTVVMTGPKSVSVTFSPGGAGGFEEEEGTATPTATATAAPTATATPTATPTASATPTPAATPPPSGPSGQ